MLEMKSYGGAGRFVERAVGERSEAAGGSAASDPELVERPAATSALQRGVQAADPARGGGVLAAGSDRCACAPRGAVQRASVEVASAAGRGRAGGTRASAWPEAGRAVNILK